MENNNEKTKLQEAGAFWIKKSKAGNSFLTGTVKSQSGEVIKVIVFKNQYKTDGSNQPDYRVYFDTSLPPQAEVAPKSSEKVATKQSEDIPF
jgi:uncharacterized protein (DUF736 family)